ERFRREALLTARLEHDHIVPGYEVGEWNGQPYFSMRHVEGRTLTQIVREKPLDKHPAAALIPQGGKARHFAHEHGVLHRDLKPANILVDGGGRPYVSDFGLAKWEEAVQGLTETDVCLGSPPYMAPEQVRDSASVSAASDVYSLGATL